ncbi:MAG: S-methyl-5-thioribose-1-phosphate isomerase [candidate division WOR-3 bacterium]|nr:S-methyl-5-thioribose-1-phosphate isomerase [candidate division WOR-3 bacterium]MCX7756987.1 S-methyl-5-thioribose-1-phosphate isomerase [candidate division WOR-3 bacterium]MDW7987846.1 S-methyl-5-thioribose-1-phosphate isomerase [candidate division WOR-3 bacterium]
MPRAIRYLQGQLLILDQSIDGGLPNNPRYIRLKTYKEVIRAIKELKIRGAPLIGVAGAYGLAIAALSLKKPTVEKLITIAREISRARPTAVNLTWAINRMLKIICDSKVPASKLPQLLLKEAQDIEAQEEKKSILIGEIGAPLLKDNSRVITICNTGWLASPGIGTALGVIYTAHRQGKKLQVYVLETRPLLQGARLTAYELKQAKIPYTVITDNMIGTVMNQIDLALVGADRIARNGDTANKIGTLSLAIVAHYYKVPFFVVAPTSSIDLTKKTGKEIPIEHRAPTEVRILNNIYITPKDAAVYNPAFDITPNSLISGIITEKGIIRPPFTKSLLKIKDAD